VNENLAGEFCLGLQHGIQGVIANGGFEQSFFSYSAVLLHEIEILNHLLEEGAVSKSRALVWSA
jgi:hypothetical protein